MRCFKMHWQNSNLSISKIYNPKQDAVKIGTSCIPVFLVTGSYTYRLNTYLIGRAVQKSGDDNYSA